MLGRNYGRIVDVGGLMRHLRAESIDALRLTPEQRVGKRADYFLFDRRVVVEVKALVDNRESKVRAAVERWKARPGWPLSYGAPPMGRLIERHPFREEINQGLFDAIMDSLERAFERGNRQIRDTRRVFALVSESYGLILFANDAVWLLNPEHVLHGLRRLWAKRDGAGLPRFRHVDWVVFLTAAHTIVDPSGVEYVPLLSVSAPSCDRTEPFIAIEDRLLRGVSNFIGLPYHASTTDVLHSVRVTAKAPVPRI
jgi:hypothetical protein